MSIYFFLKQRALWEEGQKGQGGKERRSLFLWDFTESSEDYPEEKWG
jgi:hypothetical protein